MNFLTIIEKKKNKEKISETEFEFFIKNLINGNIKDYQTTAFLMAICLNKLDEDETFYLTKAVINSGKIFSWPNEINNFIDKHSTGGIGDKVTLILLPLLSCLNVNIAKVSGRGLGYTGGTIDKLDAIKMNTNLDDLTALNILKQNHFFVMQQTKDIVPADKILYALRDTSATVNNVSLIVASIIGKKIALNTNSIYLDVKVGDGAFFPNLIEAKEFGTLAIKVAKKFNKKVICHYTDMDKPLGRSIGNLIEVKESVDFLLGIYECNFLKELIFTFATDILMDLNIVKTNQQAIELINKVIKNGQAINAFLKWNQLQNGMLKTKEDLKNFYQPKYIHIIKAKESGYVNFKSNKAFGLSLIELKAGRKFKGEQLDFLSGIYLNKYTNEYVNINQPIITVYSSTPITNQIISNLENNIEIKQTIAKTNKIILGVDK